MVLFLNPKRVDYEKLKLGRKKLYDNLITKRVTMIWLFCDRKRFMWFGRWAEGGRESRALKTPAGWKRQRLSVSLPMCPPWSSFNMVEMMIIIDHDMMQSYHIFSCYCNIQLLCRRLGWGCCPLSLGWVLRGIQISKCLGVIHISVEIEMWIGAWTSISHICTFTKLEASKLC